MAYDCPVSCPRVLHFSNPNVTYGGNPTGVDVSSPPNGGESWKAGSTHAVAWTATDLPAGVVVHITYTDGAESGYVTNRTPGGFIAAVAASQGSYSWTVPFNTGRSRRVELCVSEPFSIVP